MEAVHGGSLILFSLLPLPLWRRRGQWQGRGAVTRWMSRRVWDRLPVSSRCYIREGGVSSSTGRCVVPVAGLQPSSSIPSPPKTAPEF